MSHRCSGPARGLRAWVKRRRDRLVRNLIRATLGGHRAASLSQQLVLLSLELGIGEHPALVQIRELRQLIQRIIR
jgi:hypothetical protein